MVEQQIEEEVILADLHVHLPALLGNPGPLLEQVAHEVLHQRGLDLALQRIVPESKEVDSIRVLQDLTREVRTCLGKSVLEVRDGLTPPFHGAEVDMMLEHRPRPTVFEGGLCICEPLGRTLQASEERDIVAPGQIANGSLAICE